MFPPFIISCFQSFAKMASSSRTTGAVKCFLHSYFIASGFSQKCRSHQGRLEDLKVCLLHVFMLRIPCKKKNVHLIKQHRRNWMFPPFIYSCFRSFAKMHFSSLANGKTICFSQFPCLMCVHARSIVNVLCPLSYWWSRVNVSRSHAFQDCSSTTVKLHMVKV